jgi:hypothetical protein
MMVDPSTTDWIIAIATVITAGSVLVLFWTVYTQKKQLLVSNFEILTNYIGSEKTRYARRIMIKHYESPISKQFFEKFPKGEALGEFDDYNEWGKYIGAIYSRVSFLIQQDKELQEKFMTHHGYTMGIMWITYKPFMEMWEAVDKIKEYSEFRKIGDLCYYTWKDKIDIFLQQKKEQNVHRTKFEWLVENPKSPIMWY